MSGSESGVSTFVFLDLEGTSLPSAGYSPSITELSLVAVHRNSIMHGRKKQLPRVLNKLSVCVNPRRPVNSIAATITGLFNDELHYQKDFDENLCSTIVTFLKQLAPPVCLIAHNGNQYDFPLLKSELIRNNVTLPADVLCADSLDALRELDGIKNKTGTYERFHILNETCASIVAPSTSSNTTSKVSDKKDSSRVVKNVPPVGPSVIEIDATPDMAVSKMTTSSDPPPVPRKRKNCGCNPPHGNTELEECYTKRRLVFSDGKQSVVERTPRIEEDVTSSVNAVKRRLVFNNGSKESTPVKSLQSDDLDGIEPLEGHRMPGNVIVINHATSSNATVSTAQNVANKKNDDLLYCDETLDTPDKTSPVHSSALSDSELVLYADELESSSTNSSPDNTPRKGESASKQNGDNDKQVKTSDSSSATASTEAKAADKQGSAVAMPGTSADPVFLPKSAINARSAVCVGDTCPSKSCTPEKPEEPTPNIAVMAHVRATPVKTPQKKRKSYRLMDVHKRIVGEDFEDAHNAESDCLALVRIFQNCETELLDWIDKHRKPFSEITALPVTLVTPLPSGVFPFYLEK